MKNQIENFKSIIYLIILLLLFSCNQKITDKQESKVEIAKTETKEINQIVDSATLKIEDEFWLNYSQSNFLIAKTKGESLILKKGEYLLLAAICYHNLLDYETYHELKERYDNSGYKSLTQLEKLLENRYVEDNFTINNLYGFLKELYPLLKLNSAQSYYEKSIELEKSNPVAFNSLSMIYLINGDINKGIEFGKKSIELDNKYPEPYNNLAYAYDLQGEKQKAIDILIDCIKNCPINTESTYINYMQIALHGEVLMVDSTILSVPAFEKDEYRTKLSSALWNDDLRVLKIADELFSYNSYNEVRLFLKNFSLVKPNDKDRLMYYYLLGISSKIMNDDKTFKKQVDKLVELKEFVILLEMGNYFYSLQEMEIAAHLYRKSEPFAMDEKSKLQVYANMGAVELQIGHYEKALDSFFKALKINNSDVITLTNIGVLYHYKGENKKAKDYLLKAKQNCSSDQQMESINKWLKEIG